MPTTPSVTRVAARWATRTAADPGEVGGGWEPGHLREEDGWEPGHAVPRGNDPYAYEEQGSAVPPERTSYGEEIDDEGEVIPNVERVAALWLAPAARTMEKQAVYGTKTDLSWSLGVSKVQSAEVDGDGDGGNVTFKATLGAETTFRTSGKNYPYRIFLLPLIIDASFAADSSWWQVNQVTQAGGEPKLRPSFLIDLVHDALEWPGLRADLIRQWQAKKV